VPERERCLLRGFLEAISVTITCGKTQITGVDVDAAGEAAVDAAIDAVVDTTVDAGAGNRKRK
jgi:hypothetical protein